MRDLLDLYETRKAAGHLAQLHELVQPTLEELARTLGYQRVLVAQIDGDRSIVVGAVGIDIHTNALAGFEGPFAGPIGQSLRVGRPIRVDDALRDGRLYESSRAFYADAGMLSFAAIPLLPASSVLVVSGDRPVSEAEVNELLPYAGRLIATLSQGIETRRQQEIGEQSTVEKEWLRWMLNSVQDPVVLADEQNRILLHNLHAERLLLAQPEDSPGKRRAIELNNVLLLAALSSLALGHDAALGRELTLVDPIEGAELVYEVISQPATNLRTGESALVAVLKDVTDLRRAGEELHQSMERLQSAAENVRLERDRLNLIIENVVDPIVVADPAGDIVLMNQPASRLLGPVALAGQPVAARAMVYLANDAKLSSFLSHLRFEAAPLRRGEIQLTDPDSSESLTMSASATEVRDELGQVSAVVVVLHDLTRIRELEQRRVEQQLFESEKLAAVGRVAATVAHEINNPLEAIQNALYLVLSNTPEDAPTRHFLEIARKETVRVSDIIRQMLGFYRPAAAKEPTNVNIVVDEALDLLARPLEQQGIALVKELNPKLPRVEVAADQLKQVLLNLFLNAQEAMAGGGTLHVSTSLSRDNDATFLAGPYILIQVRDTGAGIPEEHLPHIFEPFYSTKPIARGTGIGLWVTQGIVQNYGGQLKVLSRPGYGTTFTVALPPEEKREPGRP
ncbi:MAG: PAS domain S-box protein [Chloroflexi bacterium]|nr:PAS domain S-box protein [Chloroflexota bacterium]